MTKRASREPERPRRFHRSFQMGRPEPTTLALASWCARTGGRRPFSEGATAPVCSWLHTNWRAPPRLLLRRTEFLPRQESFASLHILTRRASEGSEALPSLARRVRMSFFGARVIIPFFPFRWFRLSEQIDRRGRNGRNSVLRLPGYGSWGRARTGSWLCTNWRAPTNSWSSVGRPLQEAYLRGETVGLLRSPSRSTRGLGRASRPVVQRPRQGSLEPPYLTIYLLVQA